VSRFHAASLVTQVVGHLALTVLSDLDEPPWNRITSRHVLSHTTGLLNWRPSGEELRPFRPPGQQWGYSGEGFVLLQEAIEDQAGLPIAELAQELVFSPLGMSDSQLDQPEAGLYGSRPLIITALDYGLFLAYVLGLDDERWHVPERDLQRREQPPILDDHGKAVESASLWKGRCRISLVRFDNLAAHYGAGFRCDDRAPTRRSGRLG
jgi:CubicO group peptidase (beta-lactamase class C family)